jgi:hypothetical protein
VSDLARFEAAAASEAVDDRTRGLNHHLLILLEHRRDGRLRVLARNPTLAQMRNQERVPLWVRAQTAASPALREPTIIEVSVSFKAIKSAFNGIYLHAFLEKLLSQEESAVLASRKQIKRAGVGGVVTAAGENTLPLFEGQLVTLVKRSFFPDT